jgi:adenylate cyclase
LGKEIEKKYLLAEMPVGVADGTEILQGYLSCGDPEVRVRAKGGQFFATRKGGEGFVRSEEEVEISKEVFEILWPATEGRRVEKIRYRLIGSDELVWEIDEYRGHLKGLFTAEVELPGEEVQPIMPQVIAEVFVADVTLDKNYKNKALATADDPPVT